MGGGGEYNASWDFFFIKLKGHFVKIKTSLLCLQQNLGEGGARSYGYVDKRLTHHDLFISVIDKFFVFLRSFQAIFFYSSILTFDTILDVEICLKYGRIATLMI